MGVPREKLFEEVWAEPMTAVATRYGVSSSYLARICEQLNVPRPARGFWAQRAAGIELELPELPPAEPGQQLDWVRNGEAPKIAPLRTGPLRARPRNERPRTHELLVTARGIFEDVAKPRHGDSGYLRPNRGNHVAICVSKETLRRALTVANELFLSLEDRGQRVVIAPRYGGYHFRPCETREGYKGRRRFHGYEADEWRPGLPTVTVIEETVIGLTLFEVGEEVDARWDGQAGKFVKAKPPKLTATSRSYGALYPNHASKQWLPCGRLGLHAYSPRSRVEWERYWYEAQPGDFPKALELIGQELEGFVPELLKLRERAREQEEREQREYEAQRKRWEAEERERRRAQEEAERVKDFEQRMAGYRMARDIREYIGEMKRLVDEAKCTIIKGGGLDEFIEWALEHADTVDPLTSLREDIERAVGERATREHRCSQGSSDACSSGERSAQEPDESKDR
jgi:hypothetical protein